MLNAVRVHNFDEAMRALLDQKPTNFLITKAELNAMLNDHSVRVRLRVTARYVELYGVRFIKIRSDKCSTN